MLFKVSFYTFIIANITKVKDNKLRSLQLQILKYLVLIHALLSTQKALKKP